MCVQSAAFFYEDGECITNRASAMDSLDTFLVETDDSVIYFENGCSDSVQPLVIGEFGVGAGHR